MSLHCFLTSFVRVARAEQVEKTGRLEEEEEEEEKRGCGYMREISKEERYRREK